MGIKLNADELQRAYTRFIELADKKKVIYDDDLLLIASEQMDEANSVYTLAYLHVSAGTGTVPTATVKLQKGDDIMQDAACGDGPVDAALRTVDRMTGITGRLVDFSLQAVTVGKDAMGEVSLRVAFGDDVVSAKGASTDIVEASTKAYLSCVNRHLTMKAADETPVKKTATRKKATRKKAARKAPARKRATRKRT
jgi:2-isopropylmalate synthase